MARILVADDDMVIRALLLAVLQRAGHEVVAVAGGTEAAREIEGQGLDLLIADHLMPGVTGLGLTAVARREVPGIKVLIISSLGAFILAEKAREAGADAFLAKPFKDLDEVVTRVADLVPPSP